MNQIINYATAGNEHKDIISRIVHDGGPDSIKGSFGLEDFTRTVSAQIKNKKIDIYLLDITIAPTPAAIVEYVKFLRTLKDKMRIIVIAPNLRDNAVISCLISYGVYDIVTPTITKEESLAYAETLTEAISFAIDSPRTFAMVVNQLNIGVTSSGETVSHETQSTLSDKDIRTYLLYKSNTTRNRLTAGLDKQNTFNLVGNENLSEVAVSDLSIFKVDLLLLEEPTEDEVYSIINITKVLKKQIKIICFFQDFNKFDVVASIQSITPIVYDGSFKDFDRAVRDTYLEKIKKVTQEARNSRSRVFTIVGRKGGTGKTSLACMMAKTFKDKSSTPLKVCVVDFGMFPGDLGSKCGIVEPIPNLYQWLNAILEKQKQGYNIENLKDQVSNYTHYNKNDGFYVLPTSYTNVFDYCAFAHTQDEIEKAYQFTIDALKDQYDIVILDATGDTASREIALQKATDVILATDASLGGVYQLRTVFGELVNNEYVSNEIIRVVVNRCDSMKKEHELMNIKLIKEFFKGKVYNLPFDPKFSYYLDKFDMKMNKHLSSSVLSLCADMIPVFGNKRK